MADAPDPGSTSAGTPVAPVTPAAPVVAAPVAPADPPPPPVSPAKAATGPTPTASTASTTSTEPPRTPAAAPRPVGPTGSTTAPPPRAATTTTTTTKAGSPKPDWPVQVAGQIDSLVDTIRSNTSDHLVHIARMAVYGLLVAVMGAMAVIVLIIGSIRLLDRMLPYEVWLPYFILGAIFLAAGLFLWSKRSASPAGS